MPFFMNILDQQFIGVLLLSDRQLSLNFKVGPNVTGGGSNFMSKTFEPYNLTGNTTLTINYSFDAGVTYTRYSFTISGSVVNIAAAKAAEIVTGMNADPTFSALYTAFVRPDGRGGNWVTFRPIKSREKFKTYVSNTSAESILRFNFRAGVAELPSYFRRHAIPTNSSGTITAATNATPISVTSTAHGLVTGRVIKIANVGGNTAANATWTITVVDANTFTLDGGTGSGGYTSGGGWTIVVPSGSTYSLIELSNPVTGVDVAIVTDAGLNPNIVQTDYALLSGRAGMFTFQNITVDGSDRITKIIEYPAGANLSDFCRRIDYVYSGSNTNPSQITEVPHNLSSGDLVTPPSP